MSTETRRGRKARVSHRCSARGYYGCLGTIAKGTEYLLITCFPPYPWGNTAPIQFKICSTCQRWYEGCVIEQILDPAYR